MYKLNNRINPIVMINISIADFFNNELVIEISNAIFFVISGCSPKNCTVEKMADKLTPKLNNPKKLGS